MNDPAVLFYTSDFLTGVMDLTMEERGQYITLLCYQHQKGHFKLETTRLLVGSVSVNVLNKFKQDENGLYYNERMESEKTKRQSFINSRKENGKKGGRPKKPKQKLDKTYEKAKSKPKQNLRENENDNENNKNNTNSNNIIKEIINYLNIYSSSNYKYTTKATQQKINARLKEGFTFDNFKEVINKKVNEWKDTDMEKYLRPETLFGTKFESYLNQKQGGTKKEHIPEWFDKEIKQKQISEEEKKRVG